MDDLNEILSLTAFMEQRGYECRIVPGSIGHCDSVIFEWRSPDAPELVLQAIRHRGEWDVRICGRKGTPSGVSLCYMPQVIGSSITPLISLESQRQFVQAHWPAITDAFSSHHRRSTLRAARAAAKRDRYFG